MDEFLTDCVELLAGDITAGWDPTKSTLFVELKDHIVTLRGKDSKEVIMEGVRQSALGIFRPLRAATFSKRTQDDFWLVGLLPQFPVARGYEMRVYQPTADKLPDLKDVFIPGEAIAATPEWRDLNATKR
jgi:hypothetical protein